MGHAVFPVLINEDKEPSPVFTFEWDITGRWFFKGGMYGQKMIGLPYQERAVALQAYGANSDRVARFIAAYNV